MGNVEMETELAFVLADRFCKAAGNELGQNEAVVKHRPCSANPQWAGMRGSTCSFALNGLGKSSLSISIPTPAFLPAFTGLFHVGISLGECTDKEFKRKIGQWPCYLAKKRVAKKRPLLVWQRNRESAVKPGIAARVVWKRFNKGQLE